jgi:hypothetical protein
VWCSGESAICKNEISTTKNSRERAGIVGAPNQRTFPPFVVQSLVLAMVQPKPLQEFLPLHEDKAVLHELVPLHELMPLHFTVSSARAVVIAPAANKAAADAARRVNLPISTPMARLTPQCPDRAQTGSHGPCRVRDWPITAA